MIKPFRFWVQKALPLVYDDSLSYYELLCKVVDYINNMATDVNNMVETVERVDTVVDDAVAQVDDVVTTGRENIETAINDLVAYRNNYFNNLDLQSEVNTKLDAMATNGDLGRIILNVVGDGLKRPYIVDSVNAMTNHDYLYILSSSGEVYEYKSGQGFVSTGFVYGVGTEFVSTATLNNSIDTSANLATLPNANKVYVIRVFVGTPHSSYPSGAFNGSEDAPGLAILKTYYDGTSTWKELITWNGHYFETYDGWVKL